MFFCETPPPFHNFPVFCCFRHCCITVWIGGYLCWYLANAWVGSCRDPNGFTKDAVHYHHDDGGNDNDEMCNKGRGKKNSSHGICPLLDLKVNKPLLPLSLPFSIFDSKPSVKGGGGHPETPTAEAIRLDDKLNYSLYISSISYVCMFCMIRGAVK